MIQIVGPQLRQWDVGRSVGVSDSKATHVHFANQGDSKASIMKIENGKAIIPDYLLQTGKALNAYAVLDGVTLESKSFAVLKRERPENYVYEDDQRNYIYQLITNAENAVANANQAAENANQAAEKCGTDGITPHIGNNGNWFIGETDTGMPSRGENGEPGSSGVYVGPGEIPEGYNIQIDPTGEAPVLVQSVNGVKPDENGNVVLDIPSCDGGGGLKTTELIYELVVSDEDVFFIDVPIDIRKYEHFRLWIETNVNSNTFRLGVIDASGKNFYITGSTNVLIYHSAVADFSILSNDLVYFKGYRTGFRNQYGAADGQLVSQPIVINIEASSIRLYREDHFKIGEIVRLYAVPWGGNQV